MKAESLKRIDKERDIHLQAFVNQVAKSTKQQGKKTVPIYRKFEDLYNYRKYENELLGIKKPNSKLASLIARANTS